MNNHVPLYEELLEVQEKIAGLKKQESKIKSSILEIHQDQIKQFGSVTVKDAGYKMTITTPKKVDWNQDSLAGVYKAIEASGQDAGEYIEVKYNVLESKYKAWPEAIKNEFMPARTLKNGNPSIKLEKINVA